MKRAVFLLLFIGVLTAVVTFVHREISVQVGALEAQYEKESPDKQFFANFLRFQGRKPHRLDGSVRLYVRGAREGTFAGEKHQTSLPVTRRTRLEWIADAKPPSFRIFDGHGTRMVWRIERDGAVCVEGQEFLAPDPYLE
jgi:hypothetical protein